jgi:hypothetical protein
MTEAEQIMKRCQVGTRNYDEANNLHADCYRVIGKLLKTIAGLESQEPVALETVYETIIQWDEGGGKRSRRDLARRIIDLYTHPPQRTWVGLTDEEIDKAWRSVDYTVPWEQHRIDIAQAIEAKLKEKNT